MRKATLEKRNRFLKTTEELFYKRGYKETSIKDICDALSTTTGSFYFMFDSKEGILEEIIKKYYDEILAKIDEILEKEGTLKEKLENWLEYRYEYYNENSEFFVMYNKLKEETGRASLVINESEERRNARNLDSINKLVLNHSEELPFGKERIKDIVNIIIELDELRAKDLYEKLDEKDGVNLNKEIEFSKKVLLNLLGL
jgi:AcrR family transcriptional regulator